MIPYYLTVFWDKRPVKIPQYNFFKNVKSKENGFWNTRCYLQGIQISYFLLNMFLCLLGSTAISGKSPIPGSWKCPAHRSKCSLESKSSSHRAWLPEFDSWVPHGRRKLYPQVQLFQTALWFPHVYSVAWKILTCWINNFLYSEGPIHQVTHINSLSWFIDRS